MRAVGRGRRGFTLVELAIVLLVLGVLARVTLTPLDALLERAREATTRERLAAGREALIAHLVAGGTLPCPLPLAATDTASAERGGSAVDVADAPCRRAQGALPGVALGLAAPLDAGGAALDGWGRPFRYAVSLASDATAGDPALPDWTTAGEAAAVGIGRLDADLGLCGTAAEGLCPRRALRAGKVAFVLLSTGADPTAADIQRENLDGDRLFALAPRAAVEGHRFDDLVVWASRNELVWWLLRAGWLP